MIPEAQRSELQALRWAHRALQAASPEEALWWAARAYALAPTDPAIRAVLRRIRKRCPNVRGRPPARRPRWGIAVGLFYGLLTVMALFLIARGLAGWDLGAFEEGIPTGIPVAGAPEQAPDARGDPGGRSPERSTSAVAREAVAMASPSAFPSWVPTHPSRPSPAPTPTMGRAQDLNPPATAPSRPRPAASPTPTGWPLRPGRWIRVDLSDQELIAYEGETPILRTKVSTGRARTPTVVGTFRIYLKRRTQTMTGPGYRLPDVPYVMYFHRGYALHGTYWHNNFGRPMSHGCVNLPTSVAEQLYQWADVGTLVVVQP